MSPQAYLNLSLLGALRCCREWRGLEAAWAGSTQLFVPSLSCLLCGGRLASFLASAPWLPAHFRSYIPSVALNLAQQSFSVHGLSGKGPLGG